MRYRVAVGRPGSPCRRGARGFTLLEVLVALAVVGLALGALVKAASDNVANTTYLRDKTLAHWVAMNQLNEYYVTDVWPAVGDQDEVAEMAGREWFVTVVTEDTPDDDVRRLELEVRTDEDQEYPLGTLVGYLSKPQ